MSQNVSELLQQLLRATCPEDVFGPLSGDKRTALKRRYHDLAVIVHPDHNPGAARAANEAFTALGAWYNTALQRVSEGSYGAAPRIQVSAGRQYLGYAEPIHGDLCDLFPAEGGGEPVLIKVARSPRNNDLLQAEARSLRDLGRELEAERVRAHLPTLVEQFRMRDAAGSERQANVLRAESGYSTLAEVLQTYPDGIHPADAAWMFNRMLAALGATHSCGLVHGAVLPAHVLIRPSDHNGMLIDWCYSVEQGECIQAISPGEAGAYPPEVQGREPASPATDLYMAAHCMVRLLGGDAATLELPASVPRPLRALLRGCLIPAPHRRAHDAWQLFDDFQEILEQCYGPRVFRPFRMPVPA